MDLFTTLKCQMNSEDYSALKHLVRSYKKGKIKKAFVASKKGTNSRGSGQYRSVILATMDNKNWYQYYKLWGGKNEQRAEKIISNFNILKDKE